MGSDNPSEPAPAESGSATIPVLKAVIFDVDGTLADTERDGHRPAFNASTRSFSAFRSSSTVWAPTRFLKMLVPGMK
jgi:hypothetical protein